MKSLLLLAVPVPLLLVLVCSCSPGGRKLTSADLKAFDGATPELKQSWTRSQATAATNDYVSAILTLRAMLHQNLSKEQLDAVQNALAAYDKKLMKAANRGDAATQKALETLSSPAARFER